MKFIEYRGEVLPGYVPGLPESTGRCGGVELKKGFQTVIPLYVG